jgi:predicted metal-dependent hydrolase
MVHGLYNDRLKAQGVDVDRILKNQERRMFGVVRKICSRTFTLSITAAAEHITATMADCFVERRAVFAQADPRIRAVYTWHAMEEMEHKAVAFDVYQKVAKGGYLTRMRGMLLMAILFPFHTARIMNHMFKVDGFSRWQRIKLWGGGLRWLFGINGVLTAAAGELFAYAKPSFHPWQMPVVPSYPNWVEAMERTGDPVAASNQLAGNAG